MVDLTKLSGPKLVALVAKRENVRSAALDATISAGMGMMRHSDVVALAAGSGLLDKVQIARHYLETRAAWLAAVEELETRRRYHGGDKPIKRHV